jgi:hypothetical protein
MLTSRQPSGSVNQALDQELDKLIASEENNVLFSFCFETNPTQIANAEFSIRMRIHSVEINYEKTIITEILKFFKTDLIDFDEVKKMSDTWSKAGVSYAVESHKQFHVKAEISSPYFIVPSTGSTCCEQDTDLIICYLGKTSIQSELQPKRTTFTPKDIFDLEQNFYDKLTLSVTNVQVLFINSALDWRSYLKESTNFKHHLLHPVSTRNNLYLSINPNFKKLPMFKINANCTSIRINLSDKRILRLATFAQNFKLPSFPKSSIQATSTGIPSPPSTSTVNQQPTQKPAKAKTEKINENLMMAKNFTIIKTSSNVMSAEEKDDEWDGPFNLPHEINGNPIPNYPKVVVKFEIKDVSIDLKSIIENANDFDESDYLKFLLDTIKLDFAICKFGTSMRATLGK